LKFKNPAALLDFLFFGVFRALQNSCTSINFTFGHHLQLCFKKIG